MSDKHGLEAEYRLITDHIFFEDNSRIKRSQFFIGINLALFTMLGYFFKGDAYEIDSFIKFLIILIPVVGVFISMFWAKMVGKVEGQLHLRVQRAKYLEEQIGYFIYLAHKGIVWKWYQEPSSWAILIFLAFGFALIWFIIFSSFINKYFNPCETSIPAVYWSTILFFSYIIFDDYLTVISKKRRVI